MSTAENSLQIIRYPHPTLRHISKPLKRVDAELLGYIRQMFDLMYEARGIGLAANQVDLPYRLFIINLTGDAAAKDEEHVFINPVILERKGSHVAQEGCLSLPGVYADVRRPETVVVQAYRLNGEAVRWEIKEMFARCVQHELDHLDGTLFIDRLNEMERAGLKYTLSDFEAQFVRERDRGEILSDAQIAARLLDLEKLRA